MVKIIFIISVILLSQYSLSDEKYTVEYLQERLNENKNKKKSLKERLKAAAMEKNIEKMISDSDIRYKLPNGVYVQGMLLPNHSKSPAIKKRDGLMPACVTKNYELIIGKWNKNKNAIECDIPQSELAIIDTQVSSTEIQNEDRKGRSDEYEVIRDEKGNIILIKDKKGNIVESRDSDGSVIETKLKANKYSDNINRENENNGDDPINRNKKKKKSEKQVNINKYNGNNKSNITEKNTAKINKNIYVPPPRNNNSKKSKSGVIKYDSKKYGISKGKWIKARIARQVNSSESGQIEIEVTHGFNGRYRTLPKGTIFFANKAFNTGNRRLEGITTGILLPDGEEIENIKAYIFDTSKISGLSGSIERRRGIETKNSIARSVLNAAKNIIPTGGSVGNKIASEVTGNALSNEEKSISSEPGLTIKVNPQDIFLKVSETF